MILSQQAIHSTSHKVHVQTVCDRERGKAESSGHRDNPWEINCTSPLLNQGILLQMPHLISLYTSMIIQDLTLQYSQGL